MQGKVKGVDEEDVPVLAYCRQGQSHVDNNDTDVFVVQTGEDLGRKFTKAKNV